MILKSEWSKVLPAINSATKYPSIPTYHAMGERGRLLPERAVTFDGPTLATEKIDGTNTRIVVMRGGREGPRYIIGSREELLTYSDDIVHNPALGIVDGLRIVAENALVARYTHDCVVLFGEFYGGRVTAASKAYTATQATGFRLFDAATFGSEWHDLIRKDVGSIARWRDGGGQLFASPDVLDTMAGRAGVSLVPGVGAEAPPETIEDTLTWLTNHMGAGTRASIDGKGGRAEGVVVRSATGDRRIAKIRFEDYERTLGKRGGR